MSSAPPPSRHRAPVWDVLAGTAFTVNDGLTVVRRWTGRALAPALGVALRPPLVPPSLRPGVALEALSRRGRAGRDQVGEDLTKFLCGLVPLVVEFVLDQISTTDVVDRHVDLDALVATVDLDAVIERIDLVGLTEMVIDAIDLPEIIRQSTASVASDGVRGLRMQSIEADEALSRVLDRVLPHRRRVADGDLTGPSATEPATETGPSAAEPEPPA